MLIFKYQHPHEVTGEDELLGNTSDDELILNIIESGNKIFIH